MFGVEQQLDAARDAGLLAILIIGTRQYALSEALLHEASHWHLSNSKSVNDLLGAIDPVAYARALTAFSIE